MAALTVRVRIRADGFDSEELKELGPEIADEIVRAFGYEVKSESHDTEDAWADHAVPLVAAIEHDVFGTGEQLLVDTFNAVIDGLGLPFPDVEKSLDGDLGAFSDPSIVKAGFRRPPKASAIKLNGKPLSPEEQKLLERLLSGKVIEWEKLAARLGVKSVMAAKLVSLAESFGKASDVVGKWLYDRIPAKVEAKEVEWPALTKQDCKRLGVPETQAGRIMKPTLVEQEAISYARASAGIYIQQMPDKVRAAVRELTWQAKLLRMPPEEFARQLWHRFGELNRDWRRIAITEIAMAHNNGYIATLSAGAYVVGQSAKDACPACRKFIHGRVLKVISPPEKPTASQWANCLWVGKSNYGRKRGDWVPAIILHPHCRCRWTRFNPTFQMVDGDGNVVLKPREQVLREQAEAALKRREDDKRVQGAQDRRMPDSRTVDRTAEGVQARRVPAAARPVSRPGKGPKA